MINRNNPLVSFPWVIRTSVLKYTLHLQGQMPSVINQKYDILQSFSLVFLLTDAIPASTWMDRQIPCPSGQYENAYNF